MTHNTPPNRTVLETVCAKVLEEMECAELKFEILLIESCEILSKGDLSRAQFDRLASGLINAINSVKTANLYHNDGLVTAIKQSIDTFDIYSKTACTTVRNKIADLHMAYKNLAQEIKTRQTTREIAEAWSHLKSPIGESIHRFFMLEKLPFSFAVFSIYSGVCRFHRK